jgi:hypothetical protein
LLVGGTAVGEGGIPLPSEKEQLQWCDAFYLETKARIWPRLADMCRVCSTAALGTARETRTAVYQFQGSSFPIIKQIICIDTFRIFAQKKVCVIK